MVGVSFIMCSCILIIRHLQMKETPMYFVLFSLIFYGEYLFLKCALLTLYDMKVIICFFKVHPYPAML